MMVESLVIPMDPNSTLASDIERIWHDKNNYRICVAIKPGAQCPDPQFIGRLSGPTLALLEWQFDPRFSVERNNFTALCGSYRSEWTVPGQRYHVEILGLFCQNFGVETLARNTDFDAWLNFDFRNVCLENQRHNRVTMNGAYVEMESLPPPPDAGRPGATTTPGRWRTTATSDAILPLYTRHQPPECLKPEPQDALFCSERTNDTALHNFVFEWQEDMWINKLQQQHQNRSQDYRDKITACRDGPFYSKCVPAAQDFHQNNSLPKICFVGDSHAERMAHSMAMLNFGDQVRLVPARYPELVNLKMLSQNHQKFNCVTFVIATGQWPASYTQNRPYLFNEFSTKMSRVLYEIANASSSSPETLGFRVIMRSLHRIPICQRTSVCPPKDWRSPSVMDAYSHLVRKVVADINMTDTIQYIDTSFITAPLWDISWDWNHLPRLVTDVEALYVAGAVFGVLTPSAISDKSILHVV